MRSNFSLKIEAEHTRNLDITQLLLIFVVVVSRIHRTVLATEETTVTQQVSHRAIKCQSRLWSQRGTKVNGSHHGCSDDLKPGDCEVVVDVWTGTSALQV